jgi:excisionase family DNA binding protein
MDDLAPVTPKEAAETLGVNIKSVYDRIADGTLPHIKFGRLILIPRPAFAAFLRGETVQAA